MRTEGAQRTMVMGGVKIAQTWERHYYNAFMLTSRMEIQDQIEARNDIS